MICTVRNLVATLVIASASLATGSGNLPAQEESPFLFEEFAQPANQEPVDKVTFAADFTFDETGRLGSLRVRADVIPNWHIFSVTQPPGGPQRTEISIPGDFTEARLIGSFEPDSDFHTVKYEYFDVPGQEHEGIVTWSAPIEIAAGVDPNRLVIPVRVHAQVCENGSGGQCLQYSPNLEAVSATTPVAFEGQISPPETQVVLEGWIDEPEVRPGDVVHFNVRLQPANGWVIPGFSDQAGSGRDLSHVVFTKRNDARIGSGLAVGEAIEVRRGDEEAVFFRDAVTWQTPVRIPPQTEPGTLTFNGWVGYHALPATLEVDAGTAPAAAVQFTFDVLVGETTRQAETPVSFLVPADADYGKVATIAQQEFQRGQKDAGAFAEYHPALVLAMAFVAGLILNIMPCVLPVIGIKLIALINQAKENPRRILLLNLVFSAGIVVVFLVMAGIAVAAGNFEWGSFYSSQTFVITMVALIFAFGLSMLGVWEIPIPGFVSTAGAGKTVEQEGYTGAFLKGVFTTLLATPCAGPMLIPAVAWGSAQPPALCGLLFLSLGLGMAFPFILIGFQPRLIAFLPKPGPWMETFKQWMGFVMLGAAVFFFNPITEKYQLPVLAFLLAIGIACWMAGRITFLDSAGVRFRKWTVALGMVLLGGFVSFYLMIPQYELNWQDFSRAGIDDQLARGNVVFVDFTADW